VNPKLEFGVVMLVYIALTLPAFVLIKIAFGIGWVGQRLLDWAAREMDRLDVLADVIDGPDEPDGSD
jgi:hypothetical protein